MDLFRYATNSTNSKLARTWTLSNGDNAYFSVDGTNLWTRFNNIVGADLGDFWGFNQDQTTYLPLYFSLPGATPHAEVQDAYGTQAYFSYPTNFLYYPTTNYYYENTSPDLGTNELTMLDVIGWTLATPASQPTAPKLAIAQSSAGKVTLSWPTNYTTYFLQENTNLVTGSWANSVSGYTNPATISVAGAKKFYRLYDQPVIPTVVPEKTALIQPMTNAPVIWVTRVLLPSPALSGP